MDKETTRKFLETLFSDHLAKHKGYIEIRQIIGRGVKQSFYESVQAVIDDLDTYAGNVFYGIAPRIKWEGNKKAVKYITCLWVDADVKTKDKPNAFYHTKAQALKELNAFYLKPSIIADSGNGVHCYWLLRESVEVDLFRVESILAGLIKELNADHCQDICRVFRLPGTTNLKNQAEPKETKLESFAPDIKYSLDDFKQEENLGIKLSSVVDLTRVVFDDTLPRVDLDMLRQREMAPTILAAIKNGDVLGLYPSRSERDQAVIFELLLNHFTHEQIKAIFNNPDFTVSDRYLGLGRQGDVYLKRSIAKAEQEIKEKKLVIEKPRTKKVNIPRSSLRVIDKYMPPGERLLPIERGYIKIENDENCLIYRKVSKTKTREEIKEYIIAKDIVAPDTKIKLDYLREAYFSSVCLAQEQKTSIIEFNLQDKISGIIYPSGKGKVSGTERQDRALAEKLLFYTTYRRVTKEKGKEIESLQHLYAGLEETKDISGHIRYRIELNKMYLKEMMDETGLIKAKGGEGYHQYLLPLRDKGTEKEKKIRLSLWELKKLLRYRNTDTNPLSYAVKTHYGKIGVKDWELKRKGLCREIWTYIEPTFKQAGHKIIRINIKAGEDREDVRSWILWIDRGMTVSDR